MSMLVAGPENVRSIVKGVEQGALRIKFLLDNEATYTDPIDIYARLCYAVKDTEGRVVCDPDYARAASNKSITHYDFIKAGIEVPYTIIVRIWQPDTFSISGPERKFLGE